MNIIRFIPYFSVIYLTFILFHLADQSSIRLSYTQNIWYQDFFASSTISRHRDSTNFVEADVPYYHYQQTLAYLADSSVITHIIRGQPNIIFAPSKKFYLIYSKTGQNINLYERNGTKKWSLQTPGYAHISPKGSIIMVISTDNTSITLYNQTREIILPQTFVSSYITDFSFATGNDILVIATIEGNSYYYQYLNANLLTWEAPVSTYTYTKSIEISPSAQYIATLTGLIPERLTLYQVEMNPAASDQQTTIEEMWSIPTQQELRKKNSMFIDEANNYLFDTREHTLHVSKLSNGKGIHRYPLSSPQDPPPQYTLFASVKAYYGLATYEAENTHVKIFSAADHQLLWSHTYPKTIPLNLELKLYQNAVSILLSTHVAVYRYRFYDS